MQHPMIGGHILTMSVLSVSAFQGCMHLTAFLYLGPKMHPEIHGSIPDICVLMHLY